MAASITQGTSAIAYTYGSDHSRIKQAEAGQTTLYLMDPVFNLGCKSIEFPTPSSVDTTASVHGYADFTNTAFALSGSGMRDIFDGPTITVTADATYGAHTDNYQPTTADNDCPLPNCIVVTGKRLSQIEVLSLSQADVGKFFYGPFDPDGQPILGCVPGPFYCQVTNVGPNGQGYGRSLEPDNNPNKLNHVFGNSGHNLDPLVRLYGGQSQALAAIRAAVEGPARAAVNAQGVFRVAVQVGGYNVVVDGRIVDGVVRIGTAYVP